MYSPDETKGSFEADSSSLSSPITSATTPSPSPPSPPLVQRKRRALSLPPSPPRPDGDIQPHIQAALHDFQRIASGGQNEEEEGREAVRGKKEWTLITANDWWQLQRHLASPEHRHTPVATWFHHRARFDYDPTHCTLRLRMPSPIHDCFAIHTGNAICAELGRVLRAHPTLQHRASHVTTMGSTNQDLKHGHTRSPDHSVTFDDTLSRFPAMVVETVFSHDLSDEAAFCYIEGSRSNIRSVLVFDIDYRTPEQRLDGTQSDFTLSVRLFRLVPAEDDNDVDQATNLRCYVPAKVLDNVPVVVGDGSRLVLKLSDFMHLSPGQEDSEVVLTHQSLLNRLQWAAVKQSAADSAKRTGEQPKTPPQYKLKSRKRVQDEEEVPQRRTSQRLRMGGNTTDENDSAGQFVV